MDLNRLNNAIELRDAGRKEDALKEFEELAKMESDTQERANLLGNQANCLSRLRRHAEARQRLVEANQLGGPSFFREVLDAYMTLCEGNQEVAAEKLIRLLRDASPKNSEEHKIYAEAHGELATTLYCLGRYADTVSSFKKSIPSATGDHGKRLSCYLGVCYYKVGNLNEAKEKLTESLPASPDDDWWFTAQYYLGCTSFGLGAYTRAKELFEICEFYVSRDDLEQLENVSSWLQKTRERLGEDQEPMRQ